MQVRDLVSTHTASGHGFSHAVGQTALGGALAPEVGPVSKSVSSRRRTAAAKAGFVFVPLSARLKPCPDKSRLPAPSKVSRTLATGFTLIELMIVITIILVLISIAAPIYRNSITRSKEAVLRDTLFTLRSLIDQYTLDKQKGPQSLEDLVSDGYLRDVPTDPFTGSNQTWQTEFDSDTLMSATQTEPGIIDVHSGSSLRSLSGDPYSSW